MSEKTYSIYILANSIAGPMSGGDRIWIECARRWQAAGHAITVLTTQEGIERGRHYGLCDVEYVVQPPGRLRPLGLIPLYLERTIRGCRLARRLAPSKNGRPTLVYSSSDFWPDLFPGLLLSHRLGGHWLAAYFLFAPNPLYGFRGTYRRRLKWPSLRELAYYLSQIPTYHLVRRLADLVFVTSEPDRPRFVTNRLPPSRIIVVRGGVDTQLPARVPEPAQKKYEAIYIGRFHPQKGVLELIDIWALVCARCPRARLALIGVGTLESQVRAKIQERDLENNVTLLGFQDGLAKIKSCKASRIVLHPALYDSGGMAACEAMACGLPGVSFDLPALKTYYPKGMLKAPVGDLAAFAGRILELLHNETTYHRLRQEALGLAAEWDWDRRAGEIMNEIRIGLDA